MKTLAIVIGNNDYHEGAKLTNAGKDAEAMTEVFKRLGYDVIHRANCNTQDCTNLLETFDEKIGNYQATIWYFAGHGFQFDGENYLTSIDCQVMHPTKFDCERTCIRLTEILDILKKNTNKVNIIIIDACRRSFERGGNSAFAPIQAPKGTLIAFSTSPLEGATDGGFGEHSLYTGALLQYIGREWISVEELFKKVRKTVYSLSDGKQTTWEHTSLIGDFIFNVGQLVHSLEIPYSEDVVKDADFKSNGDDFGGLIDEIRSCNWDRQNPAINQLFRINPAELNKNQQFLFGRNLLQAAGYAFNASNVFDDIPGYLLRYSADGENHVLNGILFEIYFNSRGEFRKERFKMQCFEEVMSFRKDSRFAKSFAFIKNLLEPFRDIKTFWLPDVTDTIVDVDVLATPVKIINDWAGEIEYDAINSINVFSQNVTDQVRSYGATGKNTLGLKSVMANFLSVPTELVNIVCNRELKKICFSVASTVDEGVGF